MKIMIIDDDEICIFITKNVLQSHTIDFETISFLSAQDALNSLLLQSEIESFPDLILLDLNMPWLNGLEYLEILYANGHKHQQIPICILSSSANPQDRQIATKFKSVVGFIEKPISIEKLDFILRICPTYNQHQLPNKLNLQ